MRPSKGGMVMKMMIIEHDCPLLPQGFSMEEGDPCAQLRRDGNVNASKSLVHVSACARDHIGGLVQVSITALS